MATLLEELPGHIKRLEERVGPDNPFVKHLKKQLQDILDEQDPPKQETYFLQAIPINQKK